MPDENYVPRKGSTLLIPSGTVSNPGGKHLFFVLTNPCAGNCHLLVSISTVRAGRMYDPTCILSPGDHPFIEADSYVYYARSVQLPHLGIRKCVEALLYMPREQCDEAVLERICAGTLNSPMTPRWAKEYFRQNQSR